MIMAKKVRIIPSMEQEQKLWQSVGTARFIYNWTLARQEENYTLEGTRKNGGKFISDNDLRKEFTQLKKMEEFNWLNEVSYILNKCLNITDCNYSVNCKNTSCNCYGYISQITYKIHNRLHKT